MAYMYIVHVVLKEPFTFHFTDAYSLKFMKQRTMKYSVAIFYTDEILELKDSRFHYLFKEIDETEYVALQYNKIDIVSEFKTNPENFTFISITNPYSLPMLPNYTYCPDIKTYIYRNSTRRQVYPTINSNDVKKEIYSNI